MNQKMEQVESFVCDLIKDEFELLKAQNSLSWPRSEQLQRSRDFLDQYVILSLHLMFGYLKVMNESKEKVEREDYLRNILRPRKLFLIEYYENAILQPFLINQGVANNIYLCYLSGITALTNECYKTRHVVANVEQTLKLIAIQQSDSIKDMSWNLFKGDDEDKPSIIDFGKLIARNKVSPPGYPPHLSHYNLL